jgi:hypothetical protein
LRNKSVGWSWGSFKLIIALALPSFIWADLLIYEPFSQNAGDLNGQASGDGLSGNWGGDSTTVTVVTPANFSSYGELQKNGGQIDMANGGGVDAWASATSALGDANLLDDGATLWFSLVFQKTSGGGSNEHAGFALGTERLDAAFNGARMNTGHGLGFYTRNTSVSVSTWETGGQSTGGGLTVTYSTPALIIGKIEWGATPADVETITLYSGNLLSARSLGASVSKTMTGFDQTTIDTVSMTQRNSGGTMTYDEVRFGSTLNSVTPVPYDGTFFVIQ